MIEKNGSEKCWHVGGRVRADVGVASIDEVQAALASYLFCRTGAPADPDTWFDDTPRPARPGPAKPQSRQIPAQASAALTGAGLSVFPKFLYPAGTTTTQMMQCAEKDGKTNCVFVGANGYFTLNTNFPEQAAVQVDRISPQEPSPVHPLVATATLGGYPLRPDGSLPLTALRMLLDVELGRPLGWVKRGLLYLARFEHGEAIYLAVPDGNPPVALGRDCLLYRPVLPDGERAIYLAADAAAVDALAAGGLRAKAALTGRVPNWAVLPPGVGAPFDQIVLRRVLESGLQSVEPIVGLGRPGTPGVCLRWVDSESPHIPLLPGMGKVLIYAGSPTGRALLARFPLEAAGPRRRITSTVDAFIASANPGPSRALVRLRS